MIAGNDEVQPRPIFEEVLAHEAGRDDIAAGELFDAAFGPAAALFGLDGCDEACAAQAGKVGRVALGAAGDECLDRRGARTICADNSRDSREQDALTISACAISEEKRVFTSIAGQSIAEHPPDIGDQFGVAGRDLLRKVKEWKSPPGATAVILVM